MSTSIEGRGARAPISGALGEFKAVIVPLGFRIIAHRGASGYAPESTLASFDRALALGARDVELDVQLTRDRQLVVCHDETLARYGHGSRAIKSETLADLKKLDMGSWFDRKFEGERMLTLDELFRRFKKKLTYHVELKSREAGLGPAVFDLIRRRGLEDQVVITGYDYAQLAALKKKLPSVRIGWLVPHLDPARIDKASALGFFQICPRASTVTKEDVASAKARIPEVRAWGLVGRDVRGLVERVVRAGCDGATINWPDRMTYK